MKISVDNLRGLGAIDYTSVLDLSIAPRIERKLNEPSRFSCALRGDVNGFVVPESGARIWAVKESGEFLFTGYLTEKPASEYLGWAEAGAVYRYVLRAESDEILLDQKALPRSSPFVGRSAGSALKQLVENLLPGRFDTSGVAEVDGLTAYEVNPQKKFSEHARAIALEARARYFAVNGGIEFGPVGATNYALDEGDPKFSPSGLRVSCGTGALNDVTVIGLNEPQAYVRDYFVGDGLSLRFYLSQAPFQQNRRAMIDEKYSALDRTTWKISDPASAISAGAQALQVSGGTGRDGQSTVSYIERIELGGALEMQHGDITFSAASHGVIGGLYAGSISQAGCLAGFAVMPSGGGSQIQALINGTVAGSILTTKADHRYVLTTYAYSTEVYRSRQTYHSSLHAAGNGLGGDEIAGNVRVVLEVQDIDPAVPASMLARATVLYDDVIQNAPAFCSYCLVNAMNMQCSIANTYVRHIPTVEVRSALPNAAFETRLVESLSDGGECAVGSASLDFYPQYVPAKDLLIVASYRGFGRAVAQMADTGAIAALASGNDDGVRSMVKTIQAPAARTQEDCENAARAMLEDAAGQAWEGSYETWSDFLPGGAADVFPGDGVEINVPSQKAVFGAIVRKIEVELRDPANDRGLYRIEFANDLAQPLAREDASRATVVPMQDLPVRLAVADAGWYYLASLTNAQLTEVSSTTVEVDIGMTLPSGFGVEIRAHDFGWGAASDRNLLGRYSDRTFTLPRLARTQTYFLRMYDPASSPPRYSRYAAALHVDYPYA